jgi:hypothetical protein
MGIVLKSISHRLRPDLASKNLRERDEEPLVGSQTVFGLQAVAGFVLLESSVGDLNSAQIGNILGKR